MSCGPRRRWKSGRCGTVNPRRNLENSGLGPAWWSLGDPDELRRKLAREKWQVRVL
jgi:hypothetical protein